MWTKATIVSITGVDIENITKKKMTVTFHMDMSMGECRYSADSSFVAPFGTMSAKQNWRDELKK